MAGALTTLVALAVIAAMGALPVLAQDNRPLTASFVESTIPASHHGTAKNFTVRIQFSEPLAVSYKTLRDHALQVENGSSRRFKRVNGSNSLWEIHARPNSDEAVTLTLPATTDCDDTYAVCTADDKPFSEAVSITDPGPRGATTAGRNAYAGARRCRPTSQQFGLRPANPPSPEPWRWDRS